MKLFRSIFRSIFPLLCLSFLAGCIESPLLDHLDAGDRLAIPQLAACPLRFEKRGLCAAIEWVKMPSRPRNKGEFRISFWDTRTGTSAGPFVDPGKAVFVELWMPEHGHPSTDVTVVPATDAAGGAIPGVYRATEVYFIMGGNWEIWVRFLDGEATWDEAKLLISVD
jgi:hypothetical protein